MSQHHCLPVMEHFYTLQGEGAYTGHAAYFIRLGGCDVGCVWCDVKESWPMDGHALMTVAELTRLVIQSGTPIAVITGGEPLLHDCTALTTALQEAGIRTHLETSASSPLSGTWDWICISPKKFKAPIPDLMKQAHELKIVVYNTSDFDWAQQYAVQVSPQCRLYLQAEWDRRDTISPQITDFVKQHPQWAVSTQVHKYLNIP